MSELLAGMEDWSLQAIVRGSSGDFTRIVDAEIDGQDPFLGLTAHHHQQFEGGFLASFPDIFDVSINGSSDELEDLYKPFLTSNSLPAQAVIDFQEQINNVEGDKLVHDHQSDQSSGSTAGSVARVSSAAYSPKYKRRKNQHKRVVVQVTAEGLASDMWAWRKYGQKPIKGSPYPRSYYRCSSSKGCLARKQVEQSCTDPGMFILTYTAEHSHSQPTRRNSLAGTVRQKFPSSKTQQSGKQEKALETPQKSQKQASSPAEELVFTQAIIKEENKDEEIVDEVVLKGEVNSENDLLMPDFEFNDDFFSGLEEFDEFISDFPPHASAQQLPLRSCS